MTELQISNYVQLLVFFFSITLCNGQVDFTDSNLPIIIIDTNQQTIPDDPKIMCDMGIIWNQNGDRNYLTDDFNDYDGRIGIEIRGSTSQQYPKKSYSVETRDSLGNNRNVNLLGLPKENDWILYGAYPDKSLMRNEITYSLFGQMHPWSPRHVYCELVINGEYKGLYTLIEKIKRDNDRIDIARLDLDDNAGDSITGGYIIKVDKLTGSSNNTWTSEYQDKLKFLYHDPQYDELTSNQREYISDYVSEFEDALYSSDFADPNDGYRNYINVESFVDFMIMQELGRTVDGYRSSSFMYKDKDSKGGKLTCGPMWDFNLSYGNADYCDAYLSTGWQYDFAEVCPFFPTEPPEWWPRLLEDPTFTKELDCRWQYLRSTILSKNSINNWIDSTALYLNEAQERNFDKWPILGEYVNWNFFIGETYEEEVIFLKEWFETRSNYLDNNFPGSCNGISPTYEQAVTSESTLIHPNPTSGLLFSSNSLANKVVEVLSIEGKLVECNVTDHRIDLSHLSNGLYYVVINNQYIKVIKQ